MSQVRITQGRVFCGRDLSPSPRLKSNKSAVRGAGGREAVASEPALTPEHALTTEHNTAQRTPHDPPRRRAQFRARRIVV
ncbi:UNVERIFIED_CONTAM: hypothetical protein FKN15_058740 [Acipenser sinensis]